MTIMQEFLVLPMEGGVRLCGVRDLPHSHFIGRDAQRLRIEGPLWVRPPKTELTLEWWERWQVMLEEAGWSVTVEPFWTGEPSGRYVRLEDVRDELLRSAR